jgi:hypothetical protein
MVQWAWLAECDLAQERNAKIIGKKTCWYFDWISMMDDAWSSFQSGAKDL